MPSFKIGQRDVGDGSPTYFIADISANHDGDLSRAIDLVHLCAEAGAEGAKFQHFRASKIVSDHGFKALGNRLSHQAKWGKSVFEVYEDASLDWGWTEDLKNACHDAGIDFFSSAYDFEAVDMLDAYVDVFKIGSGDIDWTEMLRHTGSKRKPVLLATGAADLADVQRALDELRVTTRDICLMQCNTNYTASLENFGHIHLNVLRSYRELFPEVVLGLSDHTPGHATTLGAVTLGASAIEKHFTDDNGREGPDHPFSMSPQGWREMVDRTRELELAMGSPEKTVALNERETAVLQRRCLRAGVDLQAAMILERSHIEVLRPAEPSGITPPHVERVVGMRMARDLPAGHHLEWGMLLSVEE
ncbi:MAG: N-acetylneuraminate synthase [Proteobacteria bacterium]|nr:N-acetylneuraminate synthase [Pseudomonadota bacterium]